MSTGSTTSMATGSGYYGIPPGGNHIYTTAAPNTNQYITVGGGGGVGGGSSWSTGVVTINENGVTYELTATLMKIMADLEDIKKRLAILDDGNRNHEAEAKMPALKAAYDNYKMVEAMYGDGKVPDNDE